MGSRAVVARFALLVDTIHAEAAWWTFEALATIRIRLVETHGANQLEVTRQRAVQTCFRLGTTLDAISLAS